MRKTNMDEQELLGVYDPELQAECEHAEMAKDILDNGEVYCSDCGLVIS